jgi:uncharacterized protein YkuJ
VLILVKLELEDSADKERVLNELVQNDDCYEFTHKDIISTEIFKICIN